jgi:UDP-N-acetylglucosamine 2-epimerase
MKIVTVIGTRPNFIKCAPVSREIRKQHEEVIIHTGQHYDYEMSKIFFDELKIPEPDFHLGVGSGDHGWQTSQMLNKIEEALIKIKPSLILVYGDCNGTLAGALAAAKLHIPVGHIEAGVRSFDKTMPEEINRVLTDHCSNLCFCPTETAVINLKKEGICNGVNLTGDVMVDVLLFNKKIAEKSDILKKLHLQRKQYLVATIHRGSNTDNKRTLENILDGFGDVNETIIFPMHPRTEKFLRKFNIYDKIKKNIIIIKPLGYLDFLNLMNNAKKILTDSGGIQKEAYILKVPCVTLRENTEWIETLEKGWNILVGVDRQRIIKTILESSIKGEQKNYFGDGNASKKIIEIINNLK